LVFKIIPFKGWSLIIAAKIIQLQKTLEEKNIKKCVQKFNWKCVHNLINNFSTVNFYSLHTLGAPLGSPLNIFCKFKSKLFNTLVSHIILRFSFIKCGYNLFSNLFNLVACLNPRLWYSRYASLWFVKIISSRTSRKLYSENVFIFVHNCQCWQSPISIKKSVQTFYSLDVKTGSIS